jgi:hypothetical protein
MQFARQNMRVGVNRVWLNTVSMRSIGQWDLVYKWNTDHRKILDTIGGSFDVRNGEREQGPGHRLPPDRGSVADIVHDDRSGGHIGTLEYSVDVKVVLDDLVGACPGAETLETAAEPVALRYLDGGQCYTATRHHSLEATARFYYVL